jgi:hypothetical protein
VYRRPPLTPPSSGPLVVRGGSLGNSAFGLLDLRGQAQGIKSHLMSGKQGVCGTFDVYHCRCILEGRPAISRQRPVVVAHRFGGSPGDRHDPLEQRPLSGRRVNVVAAVRGTVLDWVAFLVFVGRGEPLLVPYEQLRLVVRELAAAGKGMP